MQKDSRPKASQPCPCGSGKKYKQCCAVKDEKRRRVMRQSRKALKWIAAAAALILIVYGLSQMSYLAYTENDITEVDFSSLDRTQRRAALRAANQARCTCGCGMGLAQCVVTDSTCPIRIQNIGRIRTMVVENSAPNGSS